MVETQVGILINAVDNFSSVMQECGNSAQVMAGQIEASSSQIEGANEKSSFSLKNLGTSVSSLMTGVTNLVFAYDRVEKAQYAANKAANAYEDAVRRCNAAQEAYNQAVAKYGADSPQAIAAAENLKAKQDDVALANERAQLTQQNLNQSMISTATMIIPAVITAVTGLQGTLEDLGGALDFLAANPIGLALTAISIIVLALITNFGGFRDIVISVFTAIYNTVKPVIDAIIGIIQGLYNFIKGIVDAVAGFISWLTGAAGTASKTAASITGGGAVMPSPGVKVPVSPSIRYYQFGGFVEETGLAFLHRGEAVIPAGGSSSLFNDYSTINIYASIGSDYDVERLADKLDEIRRRKLTAHGGRMTPVG